MKKTIVLGIVFLFVLMSFTSISGIQLNNQTVKPLDRGITLYVGGSGEGNYTRIQDAIDNASDGDTVFVFDDSSPYYESIQVDKSISLVGEDRNTTVIDAYGGGDVIFVKSDEVSIFEFTLQNGNHGIEIDFDFGFCTISDNIIVDNVNGVSMFLSGDNNVIEDNAFFDNIEDTIRILYCNNNTISGNTIEHSFGTYHLTGIILFRSSGNNISNNIIKNCNDGIIIQDSDNNIVFNNLLRSGEYDGIYISESSDNKIIGNNIKYNLYWGIEIDVDSNDNVIYHNNLVYNDENAIDEGNNIWDDGKYGNYWSDYEEKYPDAKKKKEGIWDTPYEIDDGDNKDMCPLIKQWPNSVSIDKPRNKAVTNNVLLQRILERFPLLQKLILFIK